MSPSCPSQSIDPGVEATRRRTLKDDETIPSSSHSTIPNGDFVVSTENDIPIDISDASQLPTTNGLDKRALKKRRIVNAGDDKEEQPSPNVTKSRENEKKLKKREIPFILNVEEEVPIRYFVLVFLIISFHIDLHFLYLNQSKKANPRSQGEMPHFARQRFRQSVSWDPWPRKSVATLHSKEEERTTALRVQCLPKDGEPTRKHQLPCADTHGRTTL